MPKGHPKGYTTGYQPRKTDPPEMAAAIRDEYEAGASQVEIAAARGWSVKRVQGIFRRNQIKPRRAIPRNQWGPNNSRWKGEAAAYVSMHDRVYRARGKATDCSVCQTTDQSRTFDWANLTGNYNDPLDYAQMCRSCHRKYDRARRTQSVQMPSEVTAAP